MSNIFPWLTIQSEKNYNPRDGCMFTLNVLALIATTWDGYINWYEALILVSFSIPYFLIVFQSPRISRFMKRKFQDEYNCFCCIGNHGKTVGYENAMETIS